MWNENEMILAIESSIFIMDVAVWCPACRDYFHLAGVSGSIWMNFKIFFVNQMLVRKFVDLCLTLLYWITNWTLWILLLDRVIFLTHNMIKSLFYWRWYNKGIKIVTSPIL